MKPEEKRTILFISPGPTMGFHSPAFQDQYRELSKTFRGCIITTAYQKENLVIDNFYFVSMKFRPSRLRIIKFLFFCIWNALKFFFKNGSIDLISTYDPLFTGLIGLITARITGAKFAPEVNGVYTSPAEWVDNPDDLSTRIKKTIYPRIMHFVLKRADGIRLLFKEQVDSLPDIIEKKVVHSFSCYVPVSHFTNLGEDKEVLFVGFPFRRKGVDILIESFKKIAPNYPDWKLKILGWFPDPSELYRSIGDHPQIYHHKPVPPHEIAKHIGSCAILVLPSRSEAMGRVLVEAMAAGKPRIGAKVDGIPTVISDGVDGLLFEPENIDDLAVKLDLLMGDKELRTRFGTAGEIRAKREFSQAVYINNLSKFYNEVLNAR